jgi:hypothetical protein
MHSPNKALLPHPELFSKLLVDLTGFQSNGAVLMVLEKYIVRNGCLVQQLTVPAIGNFNMMLRGIVSSQRTYLSVTEDLL